MIETDVITDQIKNAIGVESEAVQFEVEKGMLKRFADAIGDSNPLWQDERYARKSRYGTIIGSPTFVRAVSDMTWFDKLLQLPCPLTRVLNGGNEIEMGEAIRPGDTIIVTNRLVEATVREGKSGKMLFLACEATYKNQFGDVMGKMRTTVIKY